MALEDPAAAEAHGGEHLLTGVTDGVAEHHVPPEAVADLWQVGPQALVEAARDVERLQLAPERPVVRVVPVPAVYGVRTEQDALKPHSPTGGRAPGSGASNA